MIAKNRRTYTRRCRVPWLGVVVMGTLIGLASCAPRSENWSTAETRKDLRVDRAELHHVVRFRGNGAQPDDAELKSLDRFLGRQARDRNTRVWVAGGDSLLDVRRQAAILTHLRKYGIGARMDSGQASGRPQAGTVRVTVVRHVVTLPTCGDWSKDPATDRSNQPTSNFGCATATNLGLMVADPSVLVRGTDIGPGDGDALARGVDKYRKGKETKPPAITPLVIQSGTGGGGAK